MYDVLCSGYLPPEYIEQHVISNKFDIFSLGVVIIKVMAGPKGYSRCGDMSSHEFIKLVRKQCPL
jgi:serine/threonine protein kinase